MTCSPSMKSEQLSDCELSSAMALTGMSPITMTSMGKSNRNARYLLLFQRGYAIMKISMNSKIESVCEDNAH